MPLYTLFGQAKNKEKADKDAKDLAEKEKAAKQKADKEKREADAKLRAVLGHSHSQAQLTFAYSEYFPSLLRVCII